MATSLPATAAAAKNITKLTENIIHIHTTAAKSAKTTTTTTFKSSMSKVIIVLFFFCIRKNTVCFTCFFEFIFRSFITRVFIRMIFNR